MPPGAFPGTDRIGSNFRGTPPPQQPGAPTAPGMTKKPAGVSPDYAMWAGLNNKVISMPAPQAPKPQQVQKGYAPPAPSTPTPAKPNPGYTTQPVKPPVSVRPAVQPDKFYAGTHPAWGATPPRSQNPYQWGGQNDQWNNAYWQQQQQNQQQNPYQQQQNPYVRPPQGFGGGGYPQLPGGMQQPPWMNYMQQPQEMGMGGFGQGWGGGMQRPQGGQQGYGQFMGGWQSPFNTPQYQFPQQYRGMPQLPTTPGAPNMPQYYRPGAMPW